MPSDHVSDEVLVFEYGEVERDGVIQEHACSGIPQPNTVDSDLLRGIRTLASSKPPFLNLFSRLEVSLEPSKRRTKIVVSGSEAAIACCSKCARSGICWEVRVALYFLCIIDFRVNSGACLETRLVVLWERRQKRRLTFMDRCSYPHGFAGDWGKVRY